MRVDVVSFTGDSGITDYSVSLLRQFVKLGLDATFVTASSISPRFEQMGFDVKKVFRRSRHYPIDIFKFFYHVLSSRPEWIILQGPIKFPVIDGVLIRVFRLFGISACVTVHDVLPHYPKPWSRFTYGFYYRSFNKAIVHSVAALNGVKELGVEVPMLIVPHGIYDIFDLTAIPQQDARLKLKNIDANDFVILFFGHLETRKGLMEFLNVAKLLESYSKIKFLIAGGSSLSKQGQHYVDRLNQAKSSSNVIVYDERIPFEEVEIFFSASNLVALPYLEGTTSGVLKLALAFSRPVVATRVGDFPEQIPYGAGEIIETTNIESDLAKAILSINDNYQSYFNAMKSAGSQAQWDHIAQKVSSFLRH